MNELEKALVNLSIADNALTYYTNEKGSIPKRVTKEHRKAIRAVSKLIGDNLKALSLVSDLMVVNMAMFKSVTYGKGRPTKKQVAKQRTLLTNLAKLYQIDIDKLVKEINL